MIGRSALAASDIPGRTCHWLLDLDVGGRTYHFSADAVDVATHSGEVLAYEPGLGALEVTRGEDPTTVAIVLATGGVDWARLVSRGLDLATCTAILRRWYEGQVLEEARVIVAGRVTEPTYGSVHEPLEFSVERVGWDETATVPPPAAVIDTRTWPLAGQVDLLGNPAELAPDEAVIGAVYPWPFGRPAMAANGTFWGATVGSFNLTGPGSPAYLAELGPGVLTERLSKLVFAGFEIEATEVHITNATGGPRDTGNSEVLPVRYTNDRLGTRVAYVSANDAITLRMTAGCEYWVTWHDTRGGGKLNDAGTGLMRRAGEISSFLLRSAGRPVAVGRMAGTALDNFLLDFALTDPITPESWIQEHLGAFLPLVQRECAEGIWFDLWRYDATEVDVEAHLTVGERGVERTSGVTYTPLDEIVNRITFKYAPVLGGEPAKTITITGSGTPDLEADELGSRVCQVSEARYGVRPITVECMVIADDGSATLAATALATWRALPRRRVSVSGGLDLDVLDVNSVVSFTDAELYLSREIAIVRSITLGLTSVSLELELIDPPGMATRSTT